MPKKSITTKTEGKHIGHACEGHLRGLVQRAIGGKGLKLARELPFKFHVNPDVVVLDDKGRVHTVIIVAFWNNADNSHMKYYRCRSEYNGGQSALLSSPDHFAENPTSAVLLYGAPGGWKEQILHDLKAQCSPCFYLPETFSKREAVKLVAIAYGEYRPYWESGKSGAREHVESVTATKPKLTPVERKLLGLIEDLLAKRLGANAKSKESTVPRRSAVRLPSVSIATRYRQPLGFLSLFTDAEIAAWRAFSSSALTSPEHCDFAIRAHFLGLGIITERKAIGRSVMVFQPAEAVRMTNGKLAYAPDLMDFKNWEKIPEPIFSRLLISHRERTRDPGSVFDGGALDQCIGNHQALSYEIVTSVPPLLAALGAKDVGLVADLLSQTNPVGPEPWHPAAGQAQFFPVWALAASAVACVRNDRSVRSDFGARNQSPPLVGAAIRLARELLREAEPPRLLKDAVTFCEAIQSRDLHAIAAASIPEILSPANSCSLLKDFYNTLTTNSSHNPLNGSVKEWLVESFPDYAWHGWPGRRSAALSKVLGIGTGRRQWQFLGVSAKEKRIVCAEVKSITANHWGDKSKELYDRIAETRAVAHSAKWALKCIGILDGDIGSEELTELSTGIGYDEVYSIEEVLGIP